MSEYGENDARPLIGQLFSGAMSTEEAIERLRTRLLDLTARNPLLNYKHPKNKCIQFIDGPFIDLVFNRLYEETRQISINYIPEPSPIEYEGKKPEVKVYADTIGINIENEFEPNNYDFTGHQLNGLQALYYPEDLEKQLGRISRDAKTAIEETGSNVLFMVFGFLQFYESEDSDRSLLAPLLSIPVSLIKGKVDTHSGTYQYAVVHNGEDLAENQTLREKLAKDFRIILPEFIEEETPEDYFEKVEKIISKKKRWKVRRQLTIGLLSFGKLAIWTGLDTKKNPHLAKHNLVKKIFSGNGSNSSLSFSEDYDVDTHPKGDLQFIFDADSSQHSAIIDVLAGKNIVINGPPGTGKSQTITNIIANAVSEGKKVLFVSEKMAALEVVRRRLTMAGLGNFCLELHSHKTQKKELLEDIDARIKSRFPAPPQINEKIQTLKNQKQKLSRYAEIMASNIGNKIGLTVNEVFWATEKIRQELENYIEVITEIEYTNAHTWVHDDWNEFRSNLTDISSLFIEVKTFDLNHPWWGLTPRLLFPNEIQRISKIIDESILLINSSVEAAGSISRSLDLNEDQDIDWYKKLYDKIDSIEDLQLIESLLPRIFKIDETNFNAAQAGKNIVEFSISINAAKFIQSEIKRVHSGTEVLTEHDRALFESKKSKINNKEILNTSLLKLKSHHQIVKQSLDFISNSISNNNLNYISFFDINQKELQKSFSQLIKFDISSENYKELLGSINIFKQNINDINTSNDRLLAFNNNSLLNYDGTFDAVSRIANVNLFSGLIQSENIDPIKLNRLIDIAKNSHSSRSLNSLNLLIEKTASEIIECKNSFYEFKKIALEVHRDFPLTYQGSQEIISLSTVAKSAPIDLLHFRNKSLFSEKAKTLIIELEQSIKTYNEIKNDVDQLFFTDALPDLKNIKNAINFLRSKDGFFAIFDSDWRRSKNIHVSLSKKVKSLTAKQRAEDLSKLVRFIEFESNLLQNTEFIHTFGGLFKGINSNIENIKRILQWYQTLNIELIKSPWVSGNIDFNSISEEKIRSLALSYDSNILNINILKNNLDIFKGVESPAFSSLANFINKDIELLINDLSLELNEIKHIFKAFSSVCVSDISPGHACKLMQLKFELAPYLNDIEKVNSFVTKFDLILPENLKFLQLNSHFRIKENCSEYINLINTFEYNISTSNFLKSNEITFSESSAFYQNYINLNKGLIDIGLNLRSVNICEWVEFFKEINNYLIDIQSVFEIANKYFAEKITISDLLKVVDQYSELESILLKLSNSEVTTEILLEVYQGIDTPVDLIVQTFEWGRTVSKLNIPINLKKKVLSSNGIHELGEFRKLFAQLIDKAAEAKDKVTELSEFGRFDWNLWLSSIRGARRTEIPSEIQSRLILSKENLIELLPWAKYVAAREALRTLGLDDFLNALEGKKIPPTHLSKAFEFAALQSIGKRIYSEYPELLRFNAKNHDRVRQEFQKLDSEIIKLNGSNFANLIHKGSTIPQGKTGLRVGEYTELSLLKHEINKQKKHIPIRKLLSRAGNALLELKPIFMMGPMSVAQYLEGDNLTFDLIVMDEASQLRPEEALGAIAKAKQLVVVGDPKQLPPTNFFDKLTESPDEENEDDAPAAITGMESILDICQQLFTPTRSLRWHYRSQHESLIAFSNFHFYKNLIVFPSPYSKSSELGVKYRYITKGIYKDRQNFPEAHVVVDAVINHMINSPHESLGVVTLNQTQRELIEELLEQKYKVFNETSNFRGKWEKEGWPFFVKNLENVQGDERDVIFISTTFGKAPGTTKPKQNFGPISRPDGWRRLNVLFTRSKKRIELFSSMSAEDIVVDEKTPLGTKALRDYLDFAKRGVLVSTDEGVRDPDSDFEIAVANVISNWGYEVRPQLGVAGFFIDLVVRNPRRPGEYLAAIECDGATYHSGCSVRDRDRIRQEILESLGWKNKIYRIWSTDWFYNPLESIGKLKSFLDSCQRKADAELDNPVNEHEHYIEIVEPAQDSNSTNQAGQIEEELIPVEFADDIFVEVGDRVTYVSNQLPNEKYTVTITDTPSNPKLNFVNEKTALALAILGLCVGEIGEVEVNSPTGKHTNELRILKIER
jgi:very-short-patch-repair endonuclease